MTNSQEVIKTWKELREKVSNLSSYAKGQDELFNKYFDFREGVIELLTGVELGVINRFPNSLPSNEQIFEVLRNALKNLKRL